MNEKIKNTHNPFAFGDATALRKMIEQTQPITNDDISKLSKLSNVIHEVNNDTLSERLKKITKMSLKINLFKS
jgi:hypothetical protein